MNAIEKIEWKVIHTFSRKDSIESGELVDVSKMAKEAGFRFPVAVTSTVWEGVIKPDEHAKSNGESTDGRLWDVLSIFRLAAKSSPGSTTFFKVICTVNGENVFHHLKAVIGPGDDPAPVITIMLSHED